MINSCPYCKKLPENPVKIAHGLRFKPLDFTCCSQCFNIIRYDENMKAVKPTELEWLLLDEKLKKRILKASLFGKLMKGLGEIL